MIRTVLGTVLVRTYPSLVPIKVLQLYAITCQHLKHSSPLMQSQIQLYIIQECSGLMGFESSTYL